MGLFTTRVALSVFVIPGIQYLGGVRGPHVRGLVREKVCLYGSMGSMSKMRAVVEYVPMS